MLKIFICIYLQISSLVLKHICFIHIDQSLKSSLFLDLCYSPSFHCERKKGACTMVNGWWENTEPSCPKGFEHGSAQVCLHQSFSPPIAFLSATDRFYLLRDSNGRQWLAGGRTDFLSLNPLAVKILHCCGEVQSFWLSFQLDNPLTIPHRIEMKTPSNRDEQGRSGGCVTIQEEGRKIWQTIVHSGVL